MQGEEQWMIPLTERQRAIRWRNVIHASTYIGECPMLTLYIADVERDASMKKLSREEAAKILEGMKVKIEIPKAAVTQWERNTALDMAIEALNCSEIPNKSDTISRQAAIDATWFEPSYTDPLNVLTEVRDRLKEFPSAQPKKEIQIVRCKDCKHWRQQTNYQGAPLSFGFCESDDMWRSLYGETCEVSHIDTDDDFYCGYAERRTDG